MAQNSFIVRGWIITLITFALALISKSINSKLLCGILFVVAVCFWYLDALFLKMERMYRWKYERVVMNRQNNESFLFDLNPYNKDMWDQDKQGNARKEPHMIAVMFSKTLIPIYVTLIFLEAALFIFVAAMKNWNGCASFQTWPRIVKCRTKKHFTRVCSVPACAVAFLQDNSGNGSSFPIKINIKCKTLRSPERALAIQHPNKHQINIR